MRGVGRKPPLGQMGLGCMAGAQEGERTLVEAWCRCRRGCNRTGAMASSCSSRRISAARRRRKKALQSRNDLVERAPPAVLPPGFVFGVAPISPAAPSPSQDARTNLNWRFKRGTPSRSDSRETRHSHNARAREETHANRASECDAPLGGESEFLRRPSACRARRSGPKAVHCIDACSRVGAH